MRRGQAIDWDRQPLGKVPDTLLAERLGVPRSDVSRARRYRKIPLFSEDTKTSTKSIDWNAQPLGKASDAKIAERLGVSTATVRNERSLRGLPAFKLTGWSCAKGIDWDAQPLGQTTDGELAERLGVSPSVVGKQRYRRGIAAFVGERASGSRKKRNIDWDSVGLGERPDYRHRQEAWCSTEDRLRQPYKARE